MLLPHTKLRQKWSQLLQKEQIEQVCICFSWHPFCHRPVNIAWCHSLLLATMEDKIHAFLFSKHRFFFFWKGGKVEKTWKNGIAGLFGWVMIVIYQGAVMNYPNTEIFPPFYPSCFCKAVWKGGPAAEAVAVTASGKGVYTRHHFVACYCPCQHPSLSIHHGGRGLPVAQQPFPSIWTMVKPIPWLS